MQKSAFLQGKMQKSGVELGKTNVHVAVGRSILEFDLDHSFLKYKKELLEYGYEVVKISIKEKYVLIHKIESRLQ